ncbi:iron-sulfur cluster assembly protein [Labrys okinawensis]|uniref:iron-sulfur cluster assembly protein n=1 Tax=Labrys okinawensis TaxID=346911 RepID=UPI0039BD3504
MVLVQPETSRQDELWRRLAKVDDPELDEPITDMGFVERAEVADDGHVVVDFRLPTYWCSPNFAFLMLDGVREALDGLSWRPAYEVRLQDHMFADEVNAGVAAGKSFGQIFGDLSGDCDVQALRETFQMKAYKRRQEGAILDLRRAGMADEDIVRLSLASYEAKTFADPEAGFRQRRYRQALLQRRPAIALKDRAFLTWEGEPIKALGAYLGELRSVRINMEFNGALCRGLKTTRYKQADFVDGEPTLVDFIMNRVPSAAPSTPAG